jgi:membrane protein
MSSQTRDYELREAGRPEPDEAELEPAPLTPRGFLAAVKDAGKEMLDDNMTMIASALAYSTFFAIPSVLLVAVGLFTLIAGPATITSLIHHFGTVMPGQASQLLGGSLHRLNEHPSSSIVMTAVGFVLAIWSTTGAMTSFMTAVNIAYDCKDGRGFVRKRGVAVLMAACIGFAFVLVAVLLMFGPQIEKRIGSALGASTLVKYVWWIAQWPILLAGLLAAFATILFLGPNLEAEKRRWRFITPGAGVAALVWLAVSGLFAVYTAKFGSYNKTWGSLSAVIVMLTWLWLSALALLFGAELNAEIEGHHRRRRAAAGRVSSQRRSAEATRAS